MEDAHPFGDVVPGEAVKPTFHDPIAGYQPRPRFVRNSTNGKWMNWDRLHPEKEHAVMPANLTPGSAPQAASVMTVYDCIVAVSKEMAQEGISKTRNNVQQNYKFRGIDDVFNALSPLLAKYRLVILPRILSRAMVERETRNGGVLFYVTVEAEFDFVSAADGSTHTVKMYGEAMDSGDKATNKAMSAAYKYAAFQTFCIPTEGDNDADFVTHEVQPRTVAASSSGRTAAFGAVGAGSSPAAAATDDGPDLGTAEPSDLPSGFRLIDDYKIDGDWHHVTWGRDAQGGWTVYKTKLGKIGDEARHAWRNHEPVALHSKKFPYLDKVERLGITREQIDGSRYRYDAESQ